MLFYTEFKNPKKTIKIITYTIILSSDNCMKNYEEMKQMEKKVIKINQLLNTRPLNTQIVEKDILLSIE